VNWGTAGHIAVAWLITMPAAGAVGMVAAVAVTYGGNLGVIATAVVTLAVAAVIVALSRRNPVNAHNVNASKVVLVHRMAPATAGAANTGAQGDGTASVAEGEGSGKEKGDGR
jgi:PiT family inorganic phosphate transporter